MTTIAFDTLHHARRLKEVGVPEQQAETQAELMGEVFGYYIDNLATNEYVEARLAELGARMDAHFTAIEKNIAEIKTELWWFRWILVTVAASTVIPALSNLVR